MRYHSSEFFDKGYAFPVYDIRENVTIWQYRDEVYKLPRYAVPMFDAGIGFDVAKIDDIRAKWLSLTKQ